MLHAKSVPGYDGDDEDDDETFARKAKNDSKTYLYGSEELDDEICIHPPPKVNAALQERFGQLDVFKRPLCLVFTDGEKNLQIDDSVLKQISRINVPISVVGVCGVYRTGKSYLMNRMAQEKSGFSLGSTIRSETKGIWVWCKPHPKVRGQVLILLDTEGLSDPEKGDQEHDTKLFCLTMLMSSALIYNMKGVIDQDALNRLATDDLDIVMFSDVGIQDPKGTNYADEEEDKKTLQIIAPHFVLCLRDFFFQLVHNGEVTPDEYMASCLEESQDKQNDDYNSIRNSIKTFFPKRNCFVLAQPAMNQQLINIETLREDELDSGFRKDVNRMITFVQDLGPKRLDKVTKKRWDGNAFDTFLRSYIQALSGGKKMEYVTAMRNAGRYHNKKLVVKISQEYQKKLAKVTLPQPSKLTLYDIAFFHMHDSLREFREDAYPFLVEHFEDKAMVIMKTMMNKLGAENSLKVKKLCCEYLNRKHENMVHENKTKYRSKDGVNKYEQDFEELLHKYHKKFEGYDKAERCEALHEFQETSKGQVMELKHVAKLQEEISKYKEEVEKSKKIDMEAFMSRQMEKLTIMREKKFQEELDAYKERLSKLSLGNVGFFRRLMFLFTGRMDTE